MIYAFDDFEFDAARLELRRHGAVVKADTVVLRVLAALVRNAGRLVTKEELVDEVWARRSVADNVITVSMARLRKTLLDRRDARELVVTVYGRGYRFACPVVVRTASTPPPAALPAPRDTTPPLVGRSRVLERLRDALAEAQLGRGRLCVLMGEPGIGKTCLVKAFTGELAGTGIHVGWGFCREAGSTPPLYPWLQLLRTLFESAEDDVLEQRLGPLASELRALLRESDLIASEHGPSAAGECPRVTRPRLGNFGLVTRAFSRASTSAPWVLVLDDLHRADAASLELLSLLVDEIAHSRLLVIATLRDMPGGRAPRPETQLPYILGHCNTERIALERLGESDVADYVSAIVDDVGGHLGRAVFEKSQGNPFFMAELARQLRDDEVPDPKELALPAVALDIVRQRVAELHPDTRGVLTTAAVIGSRFELSLLQTLTGKDPGAVMAALDEAIAADFVVAAPDSVTAFAFRHELLRSVLYDGLAPSERRRRHLDTASELERRAAAHEAVPPSELADHFYAAMPDTDLKKTIHYCQRAAQAAIAACANMDVARHLRHALAALALTPSPRTSHRAMLLYWLAVFTRGSDGDAFVASIKESMRLARECGHAETLIKGAMMQHVHPELVSLDGSASALEHALTLLSPEQAHLHAMALAALATCAPRAYSGAEASACLAEAERLARTPQGEEGLYYVLISKLFSEGGPAKGRDVEKIVDELEQISIRKLARTPMVPLFITVHRAVQTLQDGHVERMNAAVERGAASARKLRHPEMLWHFERFRAIAQIHTGRSTEGAKLLDTLHRQVARQPILGAEPFCAFDRAVVLTELGHPDVEPCDELRRALAPDPADPPGIWALKVRVQSAVGLLDDAHFALARVPPHKLRELPCDSQFLGTLGHLARAAIVLGHVDYAEAVDRLLEPYASYFAGSASFHCDGPVPALRGLLASVRGRHSESRRLLEVGLRMSDQAGFVLSAAEIRVALARSLLASDERNGIHAVNTLAREALATSDRLGYTRLAHAATTLLSSQRAADMYAT